MNSQEPDKKTPTEVRSRRRTPVIAALAIVAAVLVAGLFAVIADRPCPLAAGRVSPAPFDQARGKAARQAVEKLVEEQKFEAAAA
ncbi:MAG: hypothetical protein MUQ25_06565, partial [Candidatus Aminicenantes bacterium]|nr:hypothetical protein [Candidatus Aminicenantes bacterium]